MSDLVIRLPKERGELRRACLRVMERGGATSYQDAHIVARWLLGLVSSEPVACRSCGIKDTELGGLVSQMHAALNWEATPAERLRVDSRGKVFSARPDLDYIALCTSCHRKHDSWRRALPIIMRNSRPADTEGP
jgi:hypothetical protein